MITLNKLVKALHKAMADKGEVNGGTSPRAMSIRVSRSWRRYDAFHPDRPPLNLNREYVRSLHQNEPRRTYEPEFSEREELASDIIIDACLALEQEGCGNIEQVIKDRIEWRLSRMGGDGPQERNSAVN